MATVPPLPRVDHYRVYKEDTNSIASWLATTARLCGYSSDLLFRNAEAKEKKASGRLKDQARKKAREEAGAYASTSANEMTVPEKPAYMIAANDYSTLAQYIAASTKPVIDVPLSVLQLLRRAIGLRKRHAKWFAHEPSKAQLKSNETHDHFIGVLEEVLGTLQPRCSKPAPANSGEAVGDVHFTNLFANLPVETPSEAFLEAPAVQSAGSRPQAPAEPERFVAEPIRSLEEKYLAAHCLFLDLADIRDFLMKIWSVYGSGAFGLIPCSLTTYAAVSLVRRLQAEFEADMESPFDFKEMSELFFFAHCLDKGINPKRTGPNEPFNLDAYDAANQIMLLTYSLLLSFMDVLRNGNAPSMKPGFFGTYDPTSDWSKKSGREKFNEDKLLLMEALPDCCWLGRHKPAIMAEDDMVSMARGMLESRTVELWGVFSAQVFLDIHHVLRQSCYQGFQDLQRIVKPIHTTIRDNLEFHKDLRVDTWAPQNDEVLKSILRAIEDLVWKDFVHHTIQTFSRKLRGEFLLPPDFQFMHRNPLHCGLLAAYLLGQFQEAGITFINAWGSAFGLCHLHNAVQKQKLLKQAWPDLDLMIKFHKPSQIFLGDPPENADEFLKRWSLAMGASAQSFASNKRQGKGGVQNMLQLSSRGPRGLLEDTTPLCTMFVKVLAWDGIPAGKRLLHSLDQCLANAKHDSPTDAYWPALQEILKKEPELEKGLALNGREPSKFFDLCRRLAGANPSAKAQGSPSHDAELSTTEDARASKSPVILLQTLFSAISREICAFKFDYFGHHRRCWKLLRVLRQDLNADFQKYLGGSHLEHENQLPFVIGNCFMISATSQKAADSLGLSDASSAVLLKAATVMDGFLISGLGSIELVKALGDGPSNLAFEDVDLATIDEEWAEAEAAEETSLYVGMASLKS